MFRKVSKRSGMLSNLDETAPFTTCVVGLQWGDEGKGKIVDLLAREADFVARYQGGANAGHTLVVAGQKTVLHLVPSGIVHSGCQCVVANGVVIDPIQFEDELAMLRRLSIAYDGRLKVSDRAHVVLSVHKLLDVLSERRSQARLGTTGRGIGPCYTDKMARTGIRVGDLFESARLPGLLQRNLELKNVLIAAHYGEKPISGDKALEECRKFAEILKPFVCDTRQVLADAVRSGKRILFEGAQGTLLDVDHGTYPYVTSSNADTLGVCAGTGLPPNAIGNSIGVTKAYTTRVGEGPFPTELKNATGTTLRDTGQEFGATTGRPRRCGWLDLVALKYAVQINGVTSLAITKLDVLDALRSVQVATHYCVDGTVQDTFPSSCDTLASCVPVYKEFPGWLTPLRGVRRLRDMPSNARTYLEHIENALGVPIRVLSCGPAREDVIDLNG